jgi:predicted RNase H-like HicB family nuclease
MPSEKIIIWQEDGAWLGHFQDYPDYWTQGESEADLKEHLRDLYHELTDGKIPGSRKVEDLEVA